MARAVGMQRLHLTESFLAEGMAYNVGSAAVGALLGLAVAFLLVLALARIFSEALGFGITFHFNWQGFLIAYSLGVVLTFATVAFSSFRIANLNIVRAIRDLPEPQPLRGADRSIGALIKSAVGALWLVGWIAVLAVSGTVTIVLSAFVIGAVFGGLPLILSGLFGGAALMAVSALMFFGARTVRRGQFLGMQGWRSWLVWGPVGRRLQRRGGRCLLLQLSREWGRPPPQRGRLGRDHAARRRGGRLALGLGPRRPERVPGSGVRLHGRLHPRRACPGDAARLLRGQRAPLLHGRGARADLVLGAPAPLLALPRPRQRRRRRTRPGRRRPAATRPPATRGDRGQHRDVLRLGGSR